MSDRRKIRQVAPADAAAITEIYNHYVTQTAVTFEVEPISSAEMLGRIEETISSLPWLVFELEGRPESTGQGCGTPLYRQLIKEVGQLGFHSMIGGIALPNPSSERLHEKLGFKKIAHFKEVGWKFERWIDVGYWQLLL